MKHIEFHELIAEINRLKIIENALLHHDSGIYHQIRMCRKIINSNANQSNLENLQRLEKFLISVKDAGKLIDYYGCGSQK